MTIIKKIVAGALVLAQCLFLGSCTEGRENQQAGALGGALIGGLVGSAFGHGEGKMVAIAIGAMGGALLGSHLGKKLDDRDKERMGDAYYRTMEHSQTGRRVEWRNPDSGHYGSFTADRTYRNDRNEYCREFSQKIVVGGKEESGYGTACRQPDGQWRIVQQPSYH